MGKFVITGATGYIGSMLVKRLLSDASAAGEVPQITVVVRSGKKARQLFPGCVDAVETDLADSSCIESLEERIGKADYILHCAAVTKSSEMLHHPVEVAGSIVNATQNVLDLARRCGIESMVYLSSMEVYGDLDCTDGHRAGEAEAGSGRVELLDVRSCYPLGKRMAENLCHCYFKEYGVPVKIARLAQTFGRGVLPSDTRVFAQFARAARDGMDVVLHTKGNSMGNYCGISDAVDGILTILFHGADGEAYNVVNEENTMTIRQMAEFVAGQVAEGRIGVKCEISPDGSHGYAPDTGLKLSGGKLAGLGWKPREGMMEMYKGMLEDMG